MLEHTVQTRFGIPGFASKLPIAAAIIGTSLGLLTLTASPTKADCPGGWQEQEVCPECCLPSRNSAPSSSQPLAAERQQIQADRLDREGVDALNREDWEDAQNLFETALELAPDSDVIRTHLDSAKAGLADADSASKLSALHQNAEDAENAANLAALHQRLHVDEIQLAIPAACLVAGQLESDAACDVIEAGSLGWELAGANEQRWKMLHILAEDAEQKLVFMSFPSEMELESRVALIQALYAAEARQFAVLVSRIQLAMQSDQQAAKLRTEFAIRDSDAVAILRQEAADESRRDADAASRYIRAHSDSRGISFRCDFACHRIVDAARGINVFD
jgi:hypothetical protein